MFCTNGYTEPPPDEALAVEVVVGDREHADLHEHEEQDRHFVEGVGERVGVLLGVRVLAA